MSGRPRPTEGVEAEVDAALVREVVTTACGFDPGPLGPADRLDAIGLVAFDLLLCIGSLEDQLGLQFPADLMEAMETVDDLVYFTATKLSQVVGEGGGP